MLIVQGSDSSPEFLKQCLQTCMKNCYDGCKKFNQRINIYRHYVEKNFEILSQEYLFYGGRKNTKGKILLEKYQVKEKYGVVVFGRNFVTSGVVSEPQEVIITMKEKEKKPIPLSDAELLAIVADKLKDRVLFPRLLENAKKLLKDAEFIIE